MKTRLTLLAFLLINISIFAQEKSETLPMFPGCEDKVTLKEQQRCANNKLSSFIKKNLVYPEAAKKMKYKEGS